MKLHRAGANPKGPAEWSTAHDAVKAFCGFLRDELHDRRARGLETGALRHYHRKLFLSDHALDPIGVHGYASRLAPALSALRGRESTVRLLDAGCGYGTEALLFGWAGARVTGVELVPERVELARSRREFYTRDVSPSMCVEFAHADVSRYLKDPKTIEVIWIMEAISHIHPLEDFLRLAHQRLAPGGLLITSDPNALNPLALYRAWRIRGAVRYTVRVKAEDPYSGAPVCEAVERIFSVLAYTRLLSKLGFTVTQVAMSGFLGASFVPPFLHASTPVLGLASSLQRLLQTLPVLRLMGTVYTVVAEKAAASGASGRDGQPA